MKKRRFPQDVARFFNPEKSFNPKSSGIHQREKAAEKSNIPVYALGGTARKVVDAMDNVSYR